MTEKEARELKNELLYVFRRQAKVISQSSQVDPEDAKAMAQSASALVQLETFAKKEQINLD